MASKLQCPTCLEAKLSLSSYDSMMVIAPRLALFTLHCPRCGTRVSAIQPIPEELKADVERAAWSVGAGMGAGKDAQSPE